MQNLLASKFRSPPHSLQRVILSDVAKRGVELLDEGVKRIHPKAKIVKTIFGIYYDLYCPFGLKVTFDAKRG